MLGDVKDHVFHSAATAASDGAFFDNQGGFNWLLVDIDGAPTSFTLEFKYKALGGVMKAMAGLNKNDGTTLATSTATTAQSWMFDISGCKKVYMDLTAITAGTGSITVKGTGGY
jgi:hypothetical protein